MERSEGAELTQSRERVQGWTGACGVLGLFGLMMSWLAATPAGWLGGMLGAVLGVCIPWRVPAGHRWLAALRWLWALPAAGFTLRLSAQSITGYSYPGWSPWVPALLLLVLGWRGACLGEKAAERYSKLLVWAQGILAVVLLVFTVTLAEPGRLVPHGREDWKEAAGAFLLMLGAVSFLLPVKGRLPGMVCGALGGAMTAVTTGAEGAALAGMLPYPFLVLCNASAYEMRMGVLAAALWAVGEAAVLSALLRGVPGGKWAKAAGAGAALVMGYELPLNEGWALILISVGAVFGYGTMLLGLFSQRKE